MRTDYRPGQWNLLVVPGALVALPPQAAEGLIASLWERLRAERTLAVVVDAITESAGGSFATLPAFAAIVLEGANARVAVRGEARVRVTGADGTETLSGENVTTWSERFIPGAGSVLLQLSDAPEGPGLPVVGGVVRAAEALADFEPGDGVDEAAAAVPAEAVPASATPEVPAADAQEDPSGDAPADEQATESVSASAPAPDEPADAAVPAGSLLAEPAADDAEATPGDGVAEVSDQTLIPPDQTLIPADQTIDSDFDEFQQLFGDTVHVVPAPPAPVAGDHDGATISVAQARALRGDPPPAPSAPASPDAPTALIPTAGSGRVRVSTGQVVTLDRTVVIGRRPRAPRASGASLPHLIAVESPQQDISRSHLEIRPEGDTVVVIDLHTTNGSTLLRPGTDPVRLHPGEQTLVLSGDVIDLGDGVTVAFEDLP